LLSYFLGYIALVQHVLVLHFGLAGVAWYPEGADASARIRKPHIMSVVMVPMTVLICTFSSRRTKTWSIVLLSIKTHTLVSQVYCV